MVSCSFVETSYKATSYSVCVAAVTIGTGHHDGRHHPVLIQREVLHDKSRVGLLFLLRDTTPDLVINRIGLNFSISEQVKSKRWMNIAIKEHLYSKFNILFGLTNLSKLFINIHITEMQAIKYFVQWFLIEPRKSSVKLSFKIFDEKAITKQYGALTGNPVGIILGDRPDLTDYEALGIALIFEDDSES